jgi:hypothetical protein
VDSLVADFLFLLIILPVLGDYKLELLLIELLNPPLKKLEVESYNKYDLGIYKSFELYFLLKFYSGL